MHEAQQATAAELTLARNDVVGTLERVKEEVRSSPGDHRARMFLFQLLCIDGRWEQARGQLRVLAQLAPEAKLLAAAYDQAIAAEPGRSDACSGNAPAPLLRASPEWAVGIANAFASRASPAIEMRTRALDSSPDTPGEVDGRSFDYLFDGDGRFGPTFEATVAGKWGLIPFSIVEEIKSEGPRDLRDLVWLPVEIRLRDGGALAALLPARYPGAEHARDRGLQLGRRTERTEWTESDGLVRGVGQRVWTTSADEDVGILSFSRIRFAPLP